MMGKTPESPPKSIHTVIYPSYETFKRAIADKTFPESAKAVLYDNEGWKFTPPNEQQNPSYYTKAFADLAHQHGLICIATPACTLVKKMDPTVTSQIYDNYIRLEIAAGAARNADVYEIQAQGSIDNLPLFTRFVQQASQQARRANPKVKIFAGISTNPTGQVVTGEQVYNGVLSTKDYVDGYWLNIPSAGPHCPTCGKPKPKVAVAFLRQLLQEGLK